MRKLVLITIIMACSVALSACSYFRVRQTDIQQGNIVTQAMLNELKRGMSKDQVSFLLGTPVLKSTLNENVWTYVYTFQRGGKGLIKKQHLYVHFKNNHLTSISGQYYPIG